VKPGLLLISGGIDSVTLAYVLKRAGALAEMMFIDYEQASAGHQRKIVAGHADALGVRFYHEHVRWPYYARGKGFIFEAGNYPAPMADPYAPVDMNEEEHATYLEEQWDFIQGRNVAFLNYACAYAIHLGLDTVYTAFQFDEPEWAANPAGFKHCDTSAEFVAAFNRLGEIGGFSKPVQVVCPFLALRATKRQIVRMAKNMGVDLEQTYSCEFFPACGDCHQCLIRREVLAG